jgi:hypothetical protein
LTLAKAPKPVSSFISIGCQSGGPEAGVVGRAKVSLYQAFVRCLTSTHCSAIDEFALLLRVDGSLDKFSAEGFSNLRFERSRRYIKLDIQIPEASWKPLSESDLKVYLAKRVKEAISLCVARLQAEGFAVDAGALKSEIEAASGEYLASPTANSSHATKG